MMLMGKIEHVIAHDKHSRELISTSRYVCDSHLCTANQTPVGNNAILTLLLYFTLKRPKKNLLTITRKAVFTPHNFKVKYNASRKSCRFLLTKTSLSYIQRQFVTYISNRDIKKTVKSNNNSNHEYRDIYSHSMSVPNSKITFRRS